MYHDFFGITENPFSITPDPRYLFMSKGHEEALAHLLYGVSEGGGFVLLTGEVGTGKTSVCRCLLEQLPETASVALILNPRLDEIELLASICDELGVTYPRNTRSLKVLVDRLNRHLLELHAAGRHGVVIIDEAQDLSPQVLEQVRLLTNLETATRKLLQVILIGQPELSALLQRRELRQVVQRVTARYHLQPLGRADTQAYVEHRLNVGGLDPTLFSRRAIAAVYKHSRGVPRLINSLCDRCLLGAYTQHRKSVDARLVAQAAREVFGKSSRPRHGISGRLAWMGAAAAVVAALVILDPMELGLLPQAAGWRAKLVTMVSGDVGPAPEKMQAPTELERSSAEPVDTHFDAAAVSGEPVSSGRAGESSKPELEAAETGAATLEPAGVIGPDVDETEAQSQPVIALSAIVETEPPAETPAVDAPAVADGEIAGDDPAAWDDSVIAADEGVSSSGSDPQTPTAEGLAAGLEHSPELPDETMPPATTNVTPELLEAATEQLPNEVIQPGGVDLTEPATFEVAEVAQTPPALAGSPTAAATQNPSTQSASPVGDARSDKTEAVGSTTARSLAQNGTQDPAALQSARLPDPEQVLTLDALYSQPLLSVSRESALAALFGLWGLDAESLGGPVDCAKSAVLGVKCMTTKASWETLIGFNRPVLIVLQDDGGERARVVLSAIEGDRATLLAATEPVVADVATVRNQWAGEYLMLWQPPPFYSGLLALGARGPEVAWLKRRLAEASGEPQIDVQDAVFDAALQEKVRSFQRSRGLEPDGMVGVRTLIHLNTAARAEGVPLLQSSAP